MGKKIGYIFAIMASTLLVGCGTQKAPDTQDLKAISEEMYQEEAEEKYYFTECEEIETPDSAIEGVVFEAQENGQYCYVLGTEEESAQTALRDYKVVLLLADYRVEDISEEGDAFSVKKDGIEVAECAVGYGEMGYAMTLCFK